MVLCAARNRHDLPAFFTHRLHHATVRSMGNHGKPPPQDNPAGEGPPDNSDGKPDLEGSGGDHKKK